MQNSFDPYHKWLAIPPEDQPPTLYRLLGLEAGESDVDVVHGATDGRLAFLKTFLGGEHAALANRLLVEVTQARQVLASANRRAAYDRVLASAKPAGGEGEAADEPAAKAAKSRDLSGQTFGEFLVSERIHAGRFAPVYRAVHQPSGTLVALKVLPVESAKHEEMARRFRREQEVTCKLDHPNLIVGYASGETEGVRYLATEFVMGTDLSTLVRQHGPLPVDQAVDYTLQAARGLMQLHLHGIYHRNVKPGNLWIDMSGRVKITNLFLAKFEEYAQVAGAGEELTRMGQTMGTAEYLAPEQAADAKSADGRADIYSLGCTLCFLLTGRPPYGGKSMMDKLSAHRKQPIPSLRQLRADVPAEVDRAFARMLAKDPAARYTFMGEVLTALDPGPQVGWFRRLISRFWNPPES